MSEYKLIGHETYLEKFVTLYENNELPNKILLSGKKGIGKSLLTEKFLYKIFNSNKKKNNEKKNIEIDQIREIIKFTNQSSFNNKSRFIILDDVEFLNINSSNALLKNLE